MFQTKSQFRKAILIFNLLLVAVGAYCCYQALVRVYHDPATTITLRYLLDWTETVVNLLALAFGAFYMLQGYQKDVSRYLKVYMGAFAAECFLVVLLVTVWETPSVVLVLAEMLSFGCLCVLTGAENLGRKRSFTYAGIIFALQLLCLIYTCAAKSLPDGAVYFAVPNLILSALLGVFLYAKYLDKAARGRK